MDEDPAIVLQRLIAGYVLSQTIYVAAKLGVADLLANGTVTVEELAAATGSHPPSLYRFLRALASVGIFVEEDDRRFGLGPLGQHLRSGVANSLRSYAIHANEESYRAWGEALHTACTGRPGFDRVFHTSFYDYMAANAEANAVWNQSMSDTERSFVLQQGIVAAYDWSDLNRVVDVGASHGTLMAAVLQHSLHLRGVVFDLPHVVAGAPAELAKAGVAGRCEIVGGDLLSGVPEGGDAYLLSRVLFNWDDDDAMTILANCRRAMAPGGRILIMEPVIPDNGVSLASLVDLNVLVVCGGRTRTEAELAALLMRSGLRLAKTLPSPGAWNIYEARAG